MRNKLKCILLVDDDLITNQINKHYIEKSEVTDHIQVAENGQVALDLIVNKKEHDNGKTICQIPDLILLDINMPRMDGWGFLKEYQEYEGAKNTKIVMLSSSIDAKDKEKADSISAVSEYMEKPLGESKIQHIIETYFT